ncbi:hypothetical protein [Variovorax sp. MHTC-1]|uniref:hypothetical protein n=1 Tax=Variovorax sp. MHTC-1 TaxID=2495593 RepID=UPI000F884FAC|nr:hypothetical protein [Variovorax sp. MHTC-1]RST49399.1 hypothetical protein EJI01_24235 [Variovorax sp. MHTC-1]
MESSHFSSAPKDLGITARLARPDDHARIVADASKSMVRAKRHYSPEEGRHRPLVLAVLAAIGLIGLVIAASPDLLR